MLKELYLYSSCMYVTDICKYTKAVLHMWFCILIIQVSRYVMSLYTSRVIILISNLQQCIYVHVGALAASKQHVDRDCGQD